MGDQYVDRNDKLAAEFIRNAAEHDVPRGEALLGMLYFDGRGVPKDTAQVVSGCLKAAAPMTVLPWAGSA